MIDIFQWRNLPFSKVHCSFSHLLEVTYAAQALNERMDLKEGRTDRPSYPLGCHYGAEPFS